MKRFYICCVSLIVLIISPTGCAETQLYTPDDYCRKPLDKNMARFSVVRSTGGGGATAIRIHDNEQPIGDIGQNGHVCWDRYPGRARIMVMFNSTNRHLKTTTIEVDTEAGKVYELSAFYNFYGSKAVVERLRK